MSSWDHKNKSIPIDYEDTQTGVGAIEWTSELPAATNMNESRVYHMILYSLLEYSALPIRKGGAPFALVCVLIRVRITRWIEPVTSDQEVNGSNSNVSYPTNPRVSLETVLVSKLKK